MNAPAVLLRFGRPRWLVPLSVLAVAGVAAATLVGSTPTRGHGLPALSAAALVSATRQARATGFSGTVVTRVELGLPDLDIGTSDDGLTLASLLSGSHSLQVWYGGPGRERLALLGATDELDLFRSGQQVWTWNSVHRVATHAVLPARHGATSPTPTAPTASATAAPPAAGTVAPTAPATVAATVPALPAVLPGGLAGPVLAGLSSADQVRVEGHREVADRPAYELVVTPHDTGTLVGSVHIAVDGATKVPLAVQIYPRGSSDPAVDIAFTSIRLRTPPPSYFSFTPPDGAQVEPMRPDVMSVIGQALTGSSTGWTRVTEAHVGPESAAERAVLSALPAVSGTWGKGRLLRTGLVSVLVTDDGRVFFGAVEATELYAAAAH